MTLLVGLLLVSALAAAEREQVESLMGEADELEQAIDSLLEQLDEIEARLAGFRLEPAAPLWEAQGLEAQPRLRELEAGRAYGFEPGSTDWRELETLPQAVTEASEQRWASPGALVTGLVQRLEPANALGSETWEVTTRVFSTNDDEATGVILLWGFKDDALAGQDYRAHMSRDAGGWYLAQLEERFHCRRGVSDEGLCL